MLEHTTARFLHETEHHFPRLVRRVGNAIETSVIYPHDEDGIMLQWRHIFISETTAKAAMLALGEALDVVPLEDKHDTADWLLTSWAAVTQPA